MIEPRQDESEPWADQDPMIAPGLESDLGEAVVADRVDADGVIESEGQFSADVVHSDSDGYDRSHDGRVEIIVQRGLHTLTLTHEFPKGSVDETTILRGLVPLAEGYLEEGRLD
jgi:hypothetical protein